MLVCLVAIVRPIRQVPFLSKRKRAAISLPAAFILFPILSIPFAPEQAAAPKVQPLKGAGDSAVAPSTNSLPKPVAKALPQPPTIAEKTAQVQALFDEVSAIDADCAKAHDYIGQAAKSGDRYESYKMAKQAEEVCDSASDQIEAVRPPQFAKGESLEKFEKGIKELAQAQSLKSYTARGMAAVLDGDARPSLVADVEKRASVAQLSQLQATFTLMAAAGDAGIDPEKVTMSGRSKRD
jgi:hypothetical protein